jgi:glycerol kinase
MRKPLVKRHMLFTMFAGLLLLLLLAACGSTSTKSASTSSTTASTTPAATGTAVASGTAAEQALLPMMTLVGQPTAKIVTGHHTFEVVGKIKNGDTKQHDIYVQATLLDATGAIIGSTAFFNVDNVPAGGTGSFVIQGTTMQPTWVTIQVKVVGVAENIGNSGGD